MRNLEKITRQELQKMSIPYGVNDVLVKVKSNEGRTTANGVIIGFNSDVQYSEGSGSHMADVAEVHGEVILYPAKLYFKEDDPNSMTWQTDMELEKGDEVWFTFIASTNTCGFLVDGEMYLFIPYGDLYVAKRGKEIIPLNGYALLTGVKEEKSSFLFIAGEDDTDTHRAIVCYPGKPNKQYRIPRLSDDIDIAVGDLVLFRKNYVPYKLERQWYFNDFGEEYFVVQRRNIELNYGKN